MAVHKKIKLSCDQCDYQFTVQQALKKYELSVHSGMKLSFHWYDHNEIWFSCDHCDYCATHQSTIKKHSVSLCENVRYSSNHCYNLFTRQGNLKQHIQSVQKGTTFRCDQWDYQDTQKSSIKKQTEC